MPVAANDFEDRFFISAYGTSLDAIELGGASQTRELILGRPETTVRLWAMPGGAMQVGCLESIYEILREVKASGSAKGAAELIRTAVRDFKPVRDSLQGQLPAGVAVGSDGQVLELAGGFDPVAPGFIGLGF
jgi:hypothetical protein